MAEYDPVTGEKLTAVADAGQATQSDAKHSGVAGRDTGKLARGLRRALDGAVLAVIGLLVLGYKLQIAALLLRANFFLGMPATEADSGKVALVGFAGVMLTAIGGLVLVVGLAKAINQVGKRR